MATIDNLQIEIAGSAKKADTALDGLIQRLDILTKSLGKVNGNSVQNFSTSMNTLSQAMEKFKTANVTAKNFGSIANGISKFADIDATKISNVGNSLGPLSNSISTLNNVHFDNKNLQSLISSLTKLSNTNLDNLKNVNFTAFGNSMTQLAQSLSNAPKIQQSIISMTNAIARLSKSGGNIGLVATELPLLSNALSNFMKSMSSAPEVSNSTVIFTQALSSLANVGAKAETSASSLQHLATELKKVIVTLSTAPNVSQNIIDMTNALANLARTGASSGRAANSLSKSLNTYTASTANARKGTLNLAVAFGKFYANFFLVIRAVKAFGNSIKSTSDYVEAFSYYNVAFNKLGEDWGHQFEKYGYENANAYANSFYDRMNDSMSKLTGIKFDTENMRLATNEMKNLGLNIKEVTQYAAELIGITNSANLTGEASLAAADTFTKLAADYSSLINVDFKTASENFRSGLTGQSEVLYKYGLDVTDARLKTLAYSMGISKSVSNMTQAEKMQLRMIAILQQSKMAWGNLADTINQPANQMRVLKTQVQELSMMFGQLFVPILSKVIPVITGVVIALKRLMSAIAGFMGIKLGEKQDFTPQFKDIKTGADNVTDSLDDMTKSAKEAKAGLRGFDELNVINMPDTSGIDVGGANDMLDLTDELLAATQEYQKVWDEAYAKMKNQADEIANRIQNALIRIATVSKYVADIWSSGFTASFDTTSLETAQQRLSGISTQMHNIFGNKELQYSANTFFEQFLFDMGRVSADMVNIGMSIANNLLGGIEKYLTDNSDRITQYFTNMFDIGTIISKTIGDIMDDVSDIFKVFEGENATNFTSNLLEMFLNPLMSFQTMLASFIKDYLGGIKTIINDNKEQISTALDNLFLVLSNWTGPLANALTSIGEGWVETYNAHISPAIKNFTEVFSNLGETILKLWNEHISPFLADSGIMVSELMEKYIVPAVKDIIKFGGQIIEWISTIMVFLQPVISFIAETVAPLIMSSLEQIRNAAMFVFEFIGNLIRQTMSTLTGLMDFILGVFTGDFKRAGDGLVKIFKGIGNMIVGIFESVINLIIRNLNALSFDIPDWVPGLGGEQFGIKFKEVTLPRFATGGFPEDGLFMANHTELVGKFDNGKTAVANNAQIISGIEGGVERAVAKVLAPYLADIAQNTRETAGKEYGISSDAIFKSVQKSAKTFSNRTGRLAFE